MVSMDWQNISRWLAAVNTIFLLSLAGIPLNRRFFRKILYARRSIANREIFMARHICHTMRRRERVLLFPALSRPMYFKDGTAQTAEITPWFQKHACYHCHHRYPAGHFPSMAD